MRMSRQSLLAYDRLVGAAGDRAATAYERLLSLWISNNPQATENEIIDAAAYFACTTLNDYGEAAAAAADELCRQLAAQDKVSGTTHTAYAPDRKEIGKILGSQKSRKPLTQGDRAKFVAISSDRVKDECHRAANKQMLKSAKTLGCKRYARVPVGDSKTCEFCVSVAANGFHGLTEEGAKKLTRLHDNCRCKVIPGFGKNPAVEGYDPEEYKEAYELRKKLEQEGYSVSQIQRAMAGEPVESLGAPNSGKGGRQKLHTSDDPARDYYGSAESSNPKELAALKESLISRGFELIDKTESAHGKDAIGYGPNPNAGRPGQLHYIQGMSYSAWLHEADHAAYDENLGFPGLSHYLKDQALWANMERHAYTIEVDRAKAQGNHELVARLETLMREELNKHYG